MKKFSTLLLAASVIFLALPTEAARIKDLAKVQGVRSNQLIGYGLVVGLPGTGEKNNAFSEQTCRTMLNNFGIKVPDNMDVGGPRVIILACENDAFPAFDMAAMRAKPLALMMLDIDYFKSINDNYGHDAGDDVLREFAVRIRKSIRGIDLACRFGGDESGSCSRCRASSSRHFSCRMLGAWAAKGSCSITACRIVACSASGS